jgi:hypothetical protein
LVLICEKQEIVMSMSAKSRAQLVGPAANTWLIGTMCKLTIAATVAGLLLGAAIAATGLKNDSPGNLAIHTLQPLW